MKRARRLPYRVSAVVNPSQRGECTHFGKLSDAMVYARQFVAGRKPTWSTDDRGCTSWGRVLVERVASSRVDGRTEARWDGTHGAWTQTVGA